MSMKGKLGMLAAMGLMFGMQGQGLHTSYERPKKEPKRKLTPEEEVEEVKKQIRKFTNELEEENQRLSYEFGWDFYYIHDRWNVCSSNRKTAQKRFNYLMKSNYLTLEILEKSI